MLNSQQSQCRSIFLVRDTSLQTLDRLLMDAKIDFIPILERIPDGVIPKKEDLINELRMAMQNPPPPEPPAPSTSIKV